MGWYSTVSTDLSKIPDAISYYEAEIVAAKHECRITGNIEKAAANMPGIVEHRYNQLQEIEAILQYLNIELRKLRGQYFKKYFENYARALTAREVEKYIDHEPDIVNYEILINEFALLRNKWLGISKALDVKQFQLSNVVKLRCAGIEDATL